MVGENIMNGLIAKRLRQLAFQTVSAGGENPAEGYNQYNQESNMVVWEPAYADGHRHDFADTDKNIGHDRAVDPDGNELLGMYYNPGTIHHAHKVTVLYRHLKKLWKATGGKHEIFGKKFRRTYRTYVPSTA
jgi:hypothetical protein